MNSLKKEDVNKFALKNNVNLSKSELDFIYVYIKKNWYNLFLEKNIDLSKFQDQISTENRKKIEKLIIFYKNKYQMFL